MQVKVSREKDCEATLQRLRWESPNISQEATEIRVSLKKT